MASYLGESGLDFGRLHIVSPPTTHTTPAVHNTHTLHLPPPLFSFSDPLLWQ